MLRVVQCRCRATPESRSTFRFVALSILCAVITLTASCANMARDSRAQGIVWQIDNATARPAGDWNLMGVRQLLIQWVVVDDVAFVPDAGVPTAANMPDWARIGREPWAKDVVLGLAGYADENRARANVERNQKGQAAHPVLPVAEQEIQEDGYKQACDQDGRHAANRRACIIQQVAARRLHAIEELRANRFFINREVERQ